MSLRFRYPATNPSPARSASPSPSNRTSSGGATVRNPFSWNHAVNGATSTFLCGRRAGQACRQLFEEELAVRHEAKRLMRAAVHQFDYGIGVRIDADGEHRGRQQVAGGYGVKGRRHHDDDSHALDPLAHGIL